MTSSVDEESVGRELPKIFMKDKKNDDHHSINYQELKK
jgi:hypothetical protein